MKVELLRAIAPCEEREQRQAIGLAQGQPRRERRLAPHVGARHLARPLSAHPLREPRAVELGGQQEGRRDRWEVDRWEVGTGHVRGGVCGARGAERRTCAISAGSGRSMRSRTTESRAPPARLMLNRSMCTRTNEASEASIAARFSSRMRPHHMVASLQPDTSRRTVTPAAASAAAHGACTKGPRSVHLSTPSNTSKSTPTVRPLEALHVAMCSVPSTVSVILPWTKRSGTGRNCALIERRGAETRLKLRQGSPRTCAEKRRRRLVWAARQTVCAAGAHGRAGKEGRG